MADSPRSRVDRDVTFERTWLDDHTWVDLARGFIADPAEAYDTLAATVPWEPRKLWRYERWVEEPRVSAGYRIRDALPHPILADTTRAVQTQYGVKFDAFSLIWYRDGDDCQAFHRDRDMRYTENTLVAILSLGARRPWLLRRRTRRDKWIAANGGAEFDLSPAGGDLFVLGGRAQADWEHSVARVQGGAGRYGRISGQWRWSSNTGRPDSAARTPRRAPSAPALTATHRLRTEGASTVDVMRNPIWHALGGEQAAFAESVGNARRYVTDMAPFAGVPDAPTADDWDALRTLVGPGSTAFILREPVAVPEGWETTFRLEGVQMIGPPSRTDGASSDVEMTELTEADVPEMLGLVERANPGPFLPGTIRFGTYLGVRVDGALVAMAGERMRPPGYTEVSAVCTDPNHRGRGLAGALVRAVMRNISARGHQPMLHAAAENTGAVRLYELLGFTHSRDVLALALRTPA